MKSLKDSSGCCGAESVCDIKFPVSFFRLPGKEAEEIPHGR